MNLLKEIPYMPDGTNWKEEINLGAMVCLLCRMDENLIQHFPINLQKLLTQNEYRTYQRITHPRRKERYCTSRHVIKSILAQYWDANPEHIEISADIRGRPIACTPGRDSLHLSISHTRTSLAVAVCSLKPPGIDVEELRAAPLGVAQRFFTHRENVFLSRSDSFDEVFFRLWTLKESIAKFTGDGIFSILGSVEITPGETRNHYKIIKPATLRRLSLSSRKTTDHLIIGTACLNAQTDRFYTVNINDL